MKYLSVISIFLASSFCWGHARLIQPSPRNNNAGIKNGPCGGLARTATPTVVEGGKSLKITWEETVNHPGKYIFSLSPGNDVGFSQNVLATVIDIQNTGVPLPHQYEVNVMMPDIDCPNCTLQMIQSMEENPAAPSFYFSCADLNIKKSTTETSNGTQPLDQTVLNSTMPKPTNNIQYGQGCGVVKSLSSSSSTSSGLSMQWVLLCLFALLIPALAWLILNLRFRSVRL